MRAGESPRSAVEALASSAPAASRTATSIAVQFGARKELVEAATCSRLGTELARVFGVDPSTIKLLLPGGKSVSLAAHGDDTLAAVGVRPHARVKMLASTPAAITSLHAAEERHPAAWRLPSFDHELQRELQRRGALTSGSSGGALRLPSGPYTFQQFEAWQRPGLSPPPSEALKLLHRLAADPGIAGVMAKHKWSVGLLSEMPPEGKVGLSPVCILGVNVNAGQEISLRLRTDNLRGFRCYDRIRETLIHELAHMVHGEHDNAFKELNSQLRRECAQLDWKSAPASHPLAGPGPAYEGLLRYELPIQRQDAMAATAASSGQTLRELAGGTAGTQHDARAAAAAAAFQRAGVAAIQQPPPATAPAPQPVTAAPGRQQQLFGKGDVVSYQQRDGSLVQAVVVSVDHSVQPPSYGIEIGGQYRETEAHRLRLPETEPPVVEGLGHRDSATEAKEDQVRQMEE